MRATWRLQKPQGAGDAEFPRANGCSTTAVECPAFFDALTPIRSDRTDDAGA
jgi:hypothetical protein